MTRHADPVHTATLIDQCEEVPLASSPPDSGSFAFEVEFDSNELERISAGLPDNVSAAA